MFQLLHCRLWHTIRPAHMPNQIQWNDFFRTNQTHNRFLLVKTTMNDRYADWHIQVDAFKFCLNMQINARSSSLILHTHKNAAAIRQFTISLLLFCHWSLGNRLIFPFFFLCSPMNGHNTTHNYYQSCIDCLNHLINYSHWDIKLKWAEKKMIWNDNKMYNYAATITVWFADALYIHRMFCCWPQRRWLDCCVSWVSNFILL